MATFHVSLTPIDGTSASLYAEFHGGDPSYNNNRNVAFALFKDGIVYDYSDYLSQETSGADSTFSATVTGLLPGTAFTWRATLQYYDAEGWHDTDYEDSGSIVMPLDTTVQAWVFDNGWHRATAWVFDNGWHRTQPHIYDGGWG